MNYIDKTQRVAVEIGFARDGQKVAVPHEDWSLTLWTGYDFNSGMHITMRGGQLYGAYLGQHRVLALRHRGCFGSGEIMMHYEQGSLLIRESTGKTMLPAYRLPDRQRRKDGMGMVERKAIASPAVITGERQILTDGDRCVTGIHTESNITTTIKITINL